MSKEIRRVEMEKLERKTLEIANTQQAVSFLNELAKPVIEGKKERQVLMANLLAEGERGPLLSKQNFVDAIETSDGWQKVLDNEWILAIAEYVESFNCNLPDILVSEGIETRCLKRDGKLRQEVKVPTDLNGLYFLRVEEYDSKSGAIKLLGVEILNEKASSK